jgi:EAL domain-containing protein (putative c-di-GMP-specific phosphodiesterase class I)
MASATGDGAAAANEPSAPAPLVASAPRAQGAAKIHVLLVDDDDAVRNAFRRVLESRGYQVRACRSGAEALSSFARGEFDALVSDVRMPGMSGLALLRAVRERDGDLPVILMTGNPDLESAAQAAAASAFQYLVKPIESERLGRIIERAANVGRIARVKREYVEEFGSGTFRVGSRAEIGVCARAPGTLCVTQQPIVTAGEHAPFAHELRIERDSSEPSEPALQAVERPSRVSELGRAVRQLCARGSCDQDSLLFVNLEPHDLEDEALYRASAPLTAVASRVVLEITERASLESIRDLRERVARLRALGFRIALDAFGAGYAGLTSFAWLEPEFVKLDRELISELQLSATKRKIVRSLVELWHAMGIRLIGAGVEMAEEASALCELGCDYVQGSLFAETSAPPSAG